MNETKLCGAFFIEIPDRFNREISTLLSPKSWRACSSTQFGKFDLAVDPCQS